MTKIAVCNLRRVRIAPASLQGWNKMGSTGSAEAKGPAVIAGNSTW